MNQYRTSAPANDKSRTLTLLTCLVAFVIIFLVGVQIYLNRTAEYRRASDIVFNVSQTLQENIVNEFELNNILLQTTSDFMLEKGQQFISNKAELSEYLSKQILRNPSLEGLKVFDDAGRYLGTESGKHPDTTVADRDYFQKHKSNPDIDFLNSGPLKAKTTGNWIFVQSRRWNKKNGQFGGVLIATLKIDKFVNLYSNLNLGNRGVVAVMSLDGFNLMARYPMVESQLGKSFRDTHMAKEIFRQNKSHGMISIETVIDGRKRIIGYRKIPQKNLFLAVALDEEDFYSQWYRHSILMIVIAFGLSGLLVYLVLKISSTHKHLNENRAQLIKYSKLSSLGEMAAGVAHEINNPLAIIQGSVNSLLKLQKQEKLTTELISKHLKNIYDVSDRIAKIVLGLKAFSRQEDGSDKQVVSIDQILQSTLFFCKERFNSLNIPLRMSQIPEILLHCHETQISQIILNLLNNSVDAVNSLQEKWISIEFLIHEETWLDIIITDSGTGIPDHIADQMMQPFFTTKEVGKGTGLGLSISHGIAHAHGGKLFLDKECNNTRFILKLPIAIPSSKDDTSNTITSKTISSKTNSSAAS